MIIFWHWFAHATGSDAGLPYGTFSIYNFVSGFGSDLGEVTLVAAIIAFIRARNCHKRWCWRFGHHELLDPVTGVTYKLCRKHHPGHLGRKPITAAHILRIHNHTDNHADSDKETAAI